VLASEPVYAQAPPRSTDVSSNKPTTAPQRPRASNSETPAKTAATAKTTAPTPEPTASAKPEPKPTPKSSAKSTASRATSQAKKGATTKGGGGKKTVIEDEFLIEGKLEKPSAYYILRRSEVDFDWARLGATFTPLVLESVQDPLF